MSASSVSPQAAAFPDATRADPPARLTWQPHQAWISCDGSLGLTKGAWQRSDGASGYFTTLWQRDAKAGYKWVLDQGHDLSAPLAAPVMIATRPSNRAMLASMK